MGDVVGLNIGVFMGDRVKLLIGKYTGIFLEELGIIISDGHTNWEVPWFGRGLEKHEAETCGCGKNFMDGY